MTAVEIIRVIGTEFAAVSDENLETWIEIVRPMVSKKQFGNLYEQALAYLACHKMKLSGFGDTVIEGVNPFTASAGVASVSEGGSSISFGSSQSTNLSPDAELGLTVYGVQYLQLRRMVIVPIHCSGEEAE